jgi:hypothetical protein
MMESDMNLARRRSLTTMAFVLLAGFGAGVPTAWAKSPLPVRAQESLAQRAAIKSTGVAAASSSTTSSIGGLDGWIVGRPKFCLTLTTDAGERGLYLELKGDVSAVSTDGPTMALFASACAAKETQVGLHFSDQDAGVVDAVYLAARPLGSSDSREDDDSEPEDEATSSIARKKSK